MLIPVMQVIVVKLISLYYSVTNMEAIMITATYAM